MSEPLVVTLEMQALGEPQFGAWCDACALPSAVVLAALWRLGSGPWQPTTLRLCTECHEGE